MTIQIKLTDTQRQVLEHAIDHTDGHIAWFPDGVRGGAQKKVIDGLSRRALIATDGTNWFIAAEAYDALGRPRPAHSSRSAGVAVMPKTVVVGQSQAGTETNKSALRSRNKSKQVTVITMLQRPDGATIKQISEVTGWQAHTVRGAFAGAFKKRLGLIITSEKILGGDRIYRIT